MLAPDPLLAAPAATAGRDVDRCDVTPESRALLRLITTNGGFTVNQDVGQLIYSGIAVCADPELAISFPFDDWDHRAVTYWLVSVQPRLAAGDVHLGGWLDHDRGAVWLELVWVLPEHLRPVALTIARLHGQRAVFDLHQAHLIVIEPADSGHVRS